MIRRYGRKTPPALPPGRMLAHISPALPDFVDLRAWCGPIKDQGSEGSCTAHAGTSAVEWISRKYLGKTDVVFSPQYTYAKELIAQGDFPNDNGSDGTMLCRSLIFDGCCPLNDFPYIAGNIQMPTAVQESAAKAFRMGAYHGLTGSEVAKSVLGDPVPWPVEMGFTVFASFESGSVASSGIYSPSNRESILGVHEVLLVGYDLGANPTIRPRSCPPAFLVQNSWGSEWGVGGYFWVDRAVLDDAQTDLKIVHAGHPWR